jgi:hypothetical protein
MKVFLENFAAILGAASVTLLLMSICHEYGYFWSIGSRFQTFLLPFAFTTRRCGLERRRNGPISPPSVRGGVLIRTPESAN